MSAHQRILAGSFGFSQPQLLNVSFRSTERQTPERRALLIRAAESLELAYEELGEMDAAEVCTFLTGDITLAAVAFVTGLDEEEVRNEVVRQARLRFKKICM